MAGLPLDALSTWMAATMTVALHHMRLLATRDPIGCLLQLISINFWNAYSSHDPPPTCCMILLNSALALLRATLLCTTNQWQHCSLAMGLLRICHATQKSLMTALPHQVGSLQPCKICLLASRLLVVLRRQAD